MHWQASHRMMQFNRNGGEKAALDAADGYRLAPTCGRRFASVSKCPVTTSGVPASRELVSVLGVGVHQIEKPLHDRIDVPVAVYQAAP